MKKISNEMNGTDIQLARSGRLKVTITPVPQESMQLFFTASSLAGGVRCSLPAECGEDPDRNQVIGQQNKFCVVAGRLISTGRLHEKK